MHCAIQYPQTFTLPTVGKVPVEDYMNMKRKPLIHNIGRG